MCNRKPSSMHIASPSRPLLDDDHQHFHDQLVSKWLEVISIIIHVDSSSVVIKVC